MDFYTKGTAITSSPKEEVFPQIQETCKELKANISQIDRQNYSIEGKSSATWKTFGDKYTIILKKEERNTQIEIYYNRIGLNRPYKDFIELFFKILAKHIPLQSGIQFNIMNIKQESLLSNQIENNQFTKMIIPWQQIPIYNFDTKIISFVDSTIYDEVDHLILYPIELGNRLEFKNKKDAKVALTIPIKLISKIESLSEEIGSFRKKNELIVAIEFRDYDETKLIKFWIEEKSISFLIEQINKLGELENQDYHKSIPLQYGIDSNFQITNVQFKNLILAQGEEVLWSNSFVLRGVKAIARIQALTNFRVIDYDSQTHQCGRILLPEVDDVIVMNQNRRSHSERIGTFTGTGFRYGFSGTSASTSRGTSETIGDVVFMKDGIPFITFSQISDPSGLVRLAKTIKKQLFAEKKTNQTLSKPTCSKCGNSNPADSSFCNSCGYVLK
jgi:ribosomal protein L40E